jgi:hypothetical protein
MREPLLFISYCSADKRLASALYDLVIDTGTARQEEVFFTEEVVVRHGEPFSEAIFGALRSARVVLALLTPSALRRPSVIAEIAAARALDPNLEARKLRPLSVPAVHNKANWLIDALQICKAEEPARVKQLLREVASDLGRSIDVEQFDGRIAAFCKQARSLAYRGVPPWLRPLGWTLLALMTGSGAYALGQVHQELISRVDRYELTSSKLPLERTTVDPVFVGTFPRKHLSKRLEEIQGLAVANGKPPARSLQEAKGILFDALVVAQKNNLLEQHDVAALARLLADAKWDGPWDKAQLGLPCEQLTRGNDAAWCQQIRQTFDKDKRRSKAFDDAVYAALRITNASSVSVKTIVVAQNSQLELEGRKFVVTSVSLGFVPTVHLHTQPGPSP